MNNMMGAIAYDDYDGIYSFLQTILPGGRTEKDSYVGFRMCIK